MFNVSVDNYGITVDNESKKISLDPNKQPNSDFIFISHAHTDHLYKNVREYSNKIITSKITHKIAMHRGYKYGDTYEKHGFKLLDTGHILGSNGLLIEDDLYYTGDISIRKRAFMNPAVIPQAKILIIESTFGHADYIFPRFESTIHKTNLIISEMYHQGIPVILLGYTLGKAQILTNAFRHWKPLIVHDSIHEMNKLYSEFGVDMYNYVTFSDAEKNNMLSSYKPWLLIAPLGSCKNGFLKYIKNKYGALSIGFSGWAVKPYYKFALGLDYCLPLSDHCDYRDLITVIKRCSPEKIYTFHGFAEHFAGDLRKMGFDASPLIYSRGKRNTSEKLDAFFDKSNS
ncbi:MAG: exonuclease [Thaumarchaeota archaeon]|nr:MAG: exonuclease [Nitrososphaerota archaeon]TLX91663.1 MAG: exonuclease [Nitrososphaerota archaeon]